MWTAIVGKEFASRLQGRLTYVVLTLMVIGFTGLVLASFWLVVASVPTLLPVIGSSVAASTSVSLPGLVSGYRGIFLFFAMAFCMLAALAVVAPAVASAALSGEREEGTFDLLLSTGLRPRSIVFGKLVASVGFVLLVALTAVPGFAMAWMFGGVAAVDVILTALLLLAALWLFAAIGLFCSSIARASSVAALYAYGLVFLLGTGTLAIYLIGASVQMESAVRPLLALNPFISLFSVPDQISGQLAQLLPFQYRPLLDSGAQQDLFGLSAIRYPRWVLTLTLYCLLTVLLVAMSSVAIDPCHPWKARRSRRAFIDRGTE
ncbi:MAG TPA: ABC transporter permease subunit [Chloroflexota bacterium]|nr:ABC transporter permease subunit [Chloroflexota bacterium]